MVNAAVRSDSKADVAEMMTIEVLGHLSLFVPKPNQCVGRCSKSSCTKCTLRFLCSVHLVLGLLTGNKERAHTFISGHARNSEKVMQERDTGSTILLLDCLKLFCELVMIHFLQVAVNRAPL